MLAADLGGTKIAAARINSRGQVTHYRQSPTPPQGGRAALDALLDRLASLPQTGACAVAVGVPGLAYPDGSVWAPNIPGWTRMPLGGALRKRFRLPVVVESDRNALVVGEAWRGAAQRRRDVVFVAVGTGIGAGILAGGRLLRGRAELAGAVGWMAVRDRFLAAYGRRGCLETHAAGPAIGKAASRRLNRPVTARDVVRLARRGNAQARRIIEEAGRTLGLGLANLVSVLNPEMIVIGGGVAAAGDLLLGPARQSMRQWAQPLAARQVRIVRSRLGTRAGLLGVAKLAFESPAVRGGAKTARPKAG